MFILLCFKLFLIKLLKLEILLNCAPYCAIIIALNSMNFSINTCTHYDCHFSSNNSNCGDTDKAGSHDPSPPTFSGQFYLHAFVTVTMGVDICTYWALIVTYINFGMPKSVRFSMFHTESCCV